MNTISNTSSPTLRFTRAARVALFALACSFAISVSVAFSSVVFSSVRCSSVACASDRPNFLIIVADDLCWRDLGYQGHPDVKTPNIDKLATESMRLNGMFNPAATCSPTRHALYTGLYRSFGNSSRSRRQTDQPDRSRRCNDDESGWQVFASGNRLVDRSRMASGGVRRSSTVT